MSRLHPTRRARLDVPGCGPALQTMPPSRRPGGTSSERASARRIATEVSRMPLSINERPFLLRPAFRARSAWVRWRRSRASRTFAPKIAAASSRSSASCGGGGSKAGTLPGRTWKNPDSRSAGRRCSKPRTIWPGVQWMRSVSCSIEAPSEQVSLKAVVRRKLLAASPSRWARC